MKQPDPCAPPYGAQGEERMADGERPVLMSGTLRAPTVPAIGARDPRNGPDLACPRRKVWSSRTNAPARASDHHTGLHHELGGTSTQAPPAAVVQNKRPRRPGWRRRGLRTAGSGRQDSNLRPPAPHTGALPSCATPRGVPRSVAAENVDGTSGSIRLTQGRGQHSEYTRSGRAWE